MRPGSRKPLCKGKSVRAFFFLGFSLTEFSLVIVGSSSNGSLVILQN